MKRAEQAPELLDRAEHDRDELEQSLEHVAQVNRWLGGTRALLKHVIPLLNERGNTSILDVGTGSADLPRRIIDWARPNQREVAIVASDVHPQIRAIAARRCDAYPEITIQPADALSLPFDDQQFDVTTISLTLHHFDGDQQLQVLRETKRVTRRAVIVNELRRNWLNYIGARMLAASVWRGNRLTRHDGPLSVRRAFTRAELAALVRAAGMSGTVHTEFFQRVVLVATG